MEKDQKNELKSGQKTEREELKDRLMDKVRGEDAPQEGASQIDTDFLTEKIKQRPVNRRRFLRRTLSTVFLAVLFGTIACAIFFALEPVISNILNPEEKPQPIQFPEVSETEETAPGELYADDDAIAEAKAAAAAAPAAQTKAAQSAQTVQGAQTAQPAQTAQGAKAAQPAQGDAGDEEKDAPGSAAAHTGTGTAASEDAQDEGAAKDGPEEDPDAGGADAGPDESASDAAAAEDGPSSDDAAEPDVGAGTAEDGGEDADADGEGPEEGAGLPEGYFTADEYADGDIPIAGASLPYEGGDASVTDAEQPDAAGAPAGGGGSEEDAAGETEGDAAEDLLDTEGDWPLSPEQEAEILAGDEAFIGAVEQVMRRQMPDALIVRQVYGSLSSMADTAALSMVTVTGIRSDRDWFNDPYERTGQTSGVIIADTGRDILILIQGTMIGRAERLRVTFADGSSADAQMRGSDSAADIAVLSVSRADLAPDFPETIVPMTLGSSAGHALTGRPVIAVGAPTGDAGSVIYGTVTGQGIYIDLADADCRKIRTDIYTSSAASGVLIDLEGRLVGLIDMGLADEGTPNMLTAMGITELKRILELLSNGQQRAFLGVHVMDVSDQAAEEMGIPRGAYIHLAEMDSPAMAAGLQSGDVIVSCGGEPVGSASDLIRILMTLDPVETVEIVYMRLGADGYGELTTSAALRPV